jgi:hypothetical protein
VRVTLQQARAEVGERLRSRRAEIEQATLTRVYGVSDPADTVDPEYAEGLRAAVPAALDYGLTALERGVEHTPPLPPLLLVQARLAARHGVSLETVLRRYFAGFTLLGDFVIEEAERGGLLAGEALKRLLGSQAALFDRLVAAVGEEYARERETRLDSAEERRVALVEQLLAGELIDASELGYDFSAHHIGAIASGVGVRERLGDLAAELDCRLLHIRKGEGPVWAWLGARRPIDPDLMMQRLARAWPPGASVAVGEPGEGLAGWRISHQQARAAMPIVLRRHQPLVRYGEVALLASILQDNLLATSLRQLFLAPLTHERDGGATLRETLRAYFAAQRNVSSTAAALGVNRSTVGSRLRAVDEHLGRPLSSCATEVEAALHLEELTQPAFPLVSAPGP